MMIYVVYSVDFSSSSPGNVNRESPINNNNNDSKKKKWRNFAFSIQC